MKRILFPLLLAVTFTACQKPAADNQSAGNHGSPQKEAEAGGVGDAVQLKEGHGLALHPKLRASINLKLAEVTEAQIAPEIVAKLHVIQGADGLRQVALTSGSSVEASGWLRTADASLIKPGQKVELRVDTPAGGQAEKGIVKRVEKSPYAALGEYEVAVETDAPFDTGTRLTAVFRAPAGEAASAVPRSALLKTAEGWFVYTVNEDFFLRTEVKVGAMNAEYAEITDGLYTGDQVVVSPVDTLWMAELQLLRGGKPCTCGH